MQAAIRDLNTRPTGGRQISRFKYAYQRYTDLSVMGVRVGIFF